MDYNDERRILCSTSDDRSCRVYSVDFESLNQTSVPTLTNWRRAKFTHLHSLFGHEARVWRALILRDSIVTVGEDGRCCVWDDTASLYYSSIVSSGTSIWSLAAEETEDGSLIITGGADGSLVVQHVPRKMRQGISKAVVHRLLSPGMKETLIGECESSLNECGKIRVIQEYSQICYASTRLVINPIHVARMYLPILRHDDRNKNLSQFAVIEETQCYLLRAWGPQFWANKICCCGIGLPGETGQKCRAFPSHSSHFEQYKNHLQLPFCH